MSVEIDWFNGSLLEIWNINNPFGRGRNIGITILPIRFWKHIHFSIDRFGFDNNRFCFGVGLFSFFFDYPGSP